MAQQIYDTTEASNVMREILSPDIAVAYEQEAFTWNLFPDGQADFVHDLGAFWVVDLDPNPSRGAITSTNILPKGSRGSKKRHKVTYISYAMARSVEGKVIHTTKRQSLISGLGPLIAEDTRAFFKSLNIHVNGDGSGALATVEIAPTTTASMTMTKPRGTYHLLRRGLYNIVDPADGTKRTMTIGGVAKSEFYCVNRKWTTRVADFGDDEADAAADTITATTIVAGDIVVEVDSWGAMFHGIPNHLNNDSGTYQNLSRATYADRLIPFVKDLNNGPLTQAAMDIVESEVIYKKGRNHSLAGYFWKMSSAMCQALRAMGYNTDTKVVKQFAGMDKTFDPGWTTIEFNGRPVVIENDMAFSDLEFLNRPSFQKFMAKTPGVLNDHGQSFFMQVDQATARRKYVYDYFLTVFGDLGNKDILSNGRIKGADTTDLPLPQDT